MKTKFVVCVISLALLALPAAGTSVAEIGDASAMPPGQFAVIPGLTSITGALTPGDIDVYAIHLLGGGFSATTCGGATFDTQLFLFDAAGMGVLANDDGGGCGLRSLITGSPAAGLYYLAISQFDVDPVSVGGLIFPSTPFGGLYGPTGPGGGSPLSGWTGTSGSGGSYTIALTGVGAPGGPPPAVPEPATLVLLGSGLTGLLLRRKRAA